MTELFAQSPRALYKVTIIAITNTRQRCVIIRARNLFVKGAGSETVKDKKPIRRVKVQVFGSEGAVPIFGEFLDSAHNLLVHIQGRRKIFKLGRFGASHSA